MTEHFAELMHASFCTAAEGHIAQFIDRPSSSVAAHLTGWLPKRLPKLATLPLDRLQHDTAIHTANQIPFSAFLTFERRADGLDF